MVANCSYLIEAYLQVTGDIIPLNGLTEKMEDY